MDSSPIKASVVRQVNLSKKAHWALLPHSIENEVLEGVGGMSYQQYGIDGELVERIKRKMKNPATKERVKAILHGVTKADLQDRAKVRSLVNRAAKVLGENLTEKQASQIVQFVIAQKIDPNNTFHLLKLWGMFR